MPHLVKRSLKRNSQKRTLSDVTVALWERVGENGGSNDTGLLILNVPFTRDSSHQQNTFTRHLSLWRPNPFSLQFVSCCNRELPVQYLSWFRVSSQPLWAPLILITRPNVTSNLSVIFFYNTWLALRNESRAIPLLWCFLSLPFHSKHTTVNI